MGAKDAAALTKANADNWQGIPGKHDLLVLKNTHVYSCNNTDEVIYEGKRPIVTEKGPYPYREHDDFKDLNYTSE